MSVRESNTGSPRKRFLDGDMTGLAASQEEHFLLPRLLGTSLADTGSKDEFLVNLLVLAAGTGDSLLEGFGVGLRLRVGAAGDLSFLSARRSVIEPRCGKFGIVSCLEKLRGDSFPIGLCGPGVSSTLSFVTCVDRLGDIGFLLSSQRSVPQNDLGSWTRTSEMGILRSSTLS
jgi:hypothetical protein